jgi:hypothetical protein
MRNWIEEGDGLFVLYLLYTCSRLELTILTAASF